MGIASHVNPIQSNHNLSVDVTLFSDVHVITVMYPIKPISPLTNPSGHAEELHITYIPHIAHSCSLAYIKQTKKTKQTVASVVHCMMVVMSIGSSIRSLRSCIESRKNILSLQCLCLQREVDVDLLTSYDCPQYQPSVTYLWPAFYPIRALF